MLSVSGVGSLVLRMMSREEGTFKRWTQSEFSGLLGLPFEWIKVFLKEMLS